MLLYCTNDETPVQEEENFQGEESEFITVDLDEISFIEIANIILELVKPYDNDARISRLDITINIEDGVRDLRAVLFNEEKETRYVCTIEDEKLIIRETPVLFHAPVLSIDDIVIDYNTIMEKLDEIEDQELKDIINGFFLSRINLFNRQDRPSYMLRYVNPDNQNQSKVLYFDSKTGELYHTDSMGF